MSANHVSVPKPKRVRLRRTKGWRMPPNTISVTRGGAKRGMWGNVYRVGDDLSYYLGPDAERATAGQCVEMFRNAAEAWRDTDPTQFEEWIAPLRGKNLGCWCRLCDKHRDGKPFNEDCPDCAPCHADVEGCIANGLEPTE